MLTLLSLQPFPPFIHLSFYNHNHNKIVATNFRTNMSSLLFLICSCVTIFLAVTNTSVHAARQFIVGDHLGWHQPDQNNTAFYTQWAERNRFQIGDALVFEYQKDSVLTVEEMDYINCDASNPITEFTNGKSTLNLDRSGAFYFISGTDDHCIKGQKLLVEVMAPHPIPKSPPPGVSIAPEGFSPMLAPSPSYDGGHTIEEVSSSSMLLSSILIVSHLVTFGIVMLLH